MKKKTSLSDLCNKLSQQLEEEVPAGWYTMKQIAEEKGLSVEQTTKKVRKMIDEGTIVTAKFKVRSGNVCRPIIHYSLSSDQ